TNTLSIYGETLEWYYVRTSEGYFGYIQKSDASQKVVEIGLVEPFEKVPYQASKNFDGKVNVVWHQVTTVSSNSYIADALEGVHGLDVISPTWFALDDEAGNVSNIASIEYVNYAHSLGIDVWALFSNSFSSSLTHEVLSSTEKREKVIKQILAFSALYELDGINIDFESVAEEDGPYFVQFIREITPYLKNQGLVVSVDMYVPKPWTEHYNRAALGEVIDYLIIMGYDEHWGSSPESGSVASINFVYEGIIDTLAVVPNEKVILGVPYYTRRWAEETIDGDISVSSRAYSMNAAYDMLVENDAEIVWDDTVAQYYGEYTISDVLYRIWLEEERSMEEKVSLAIEYDLAGIAGWKLGLEKDDIWDVLYDYLKD
nr:glycosyl hydrolase family 18 protein [Vallitaleaceae bacterium]